MFSLFLGASLAIYFVRRRTARPVDNLPDVNHISIGGKDYVKQRVKIDGVKVGFYVPKGTVIPQEKAESKLKNLANSSSDTSILTRYMDGGLTVRTQERQMNINKSLFHLVKGDNEFYGFLFALTGNLFVTTAHLVENLTQLRIQRVSNDCDKFVFDKWEKGMSECYTIFIDSDLDLALISLHGTVLPSCKDMLRFVTENIPNSGECVYASEKVSAPFLSGVEVRVGNKEFTCLRVSRLGIGGDCGAPYILNKSSTQRLICGVHIAGNHAGLSFASPLTLDWIRTSCSRFHHSAVPSLPYEHGEPQSRIFNRFTYCGKSEIKTISATTSSYAPVPFLMHPSKIDSYWSVSHGIAKLNPFIKNGEIYTPRDIRLNKLADALAKRKHNYVYPQPVIDAVVTTFKYLKVRDVIPSYDDIVNSSVADNWNGVNAASSAGPMFPGLKKKDFLYFSEGKWFFKPETKAALGILETQLAAGQGVLFPKGLSLKDEKLPLEKVEAGQTRVFAPSDVFAYFISKKYFYSLMKAINTSGKDIGMVVNMNPEELGRFMSRFVGKLISACDGKTYEASHTFALWILFMKVMLLAGVFENEDPRLDVHPELPTLNKNNLIRWYLVLSCCLGPYIVGSDVILMEGALGSGDFLTLFLNMFASIVIIANTYYRDGKISDFISAIGNPLWSLFGDDINTLLSGDKLRLVASDMGYTLTNYDKNPNISFNVIDDVTFCSRQFYSHPILGYTMRLNLQSLAKSVMFCKKNDFFENFTDQVYNFLLESARWDEKTFAILISKMELDGISLSNYIDSYDVVCKNVANNICMKSKVDHWFTDLRNRNNPMSPEADNVVYFQGKHYAFPQGGETADGNLATTVVSGSEFVGQSAIDIEETEGSSIMPIELRDTIKELSRPVNVGQITLTGVEAAGHLIYSELFPSRYFDSSVNAVMKVMNNVIFQCDVVIRVDINALPTQSGMITLYGSPSSEVVGYSTNSFNLPHAIINIGRGQGCELRIPFLHHEQALNISDYFNNKTLFNFVNVAMRVTFPLEQVDPNILTLTVTCQLDNVRIGASGYTPNPNIPQGKPEADLPLVSKTLKTIGNVMVQASRVVREGMILASAMGFSKPKLSEGNFLSSECASRFASNIDGLDNSMSLDMYLHEKCVSHPTVFGGHEDQMLISNLVRRPGKIITINYTTLHTPGQVLKSMPLSPSYMQPLGDATGYYGTTLGVLSKLFQWYRGGLMYKFTVAKNAFQNGTLEISVNYVAGSIPSTESQVTSCHRLLWDISLQDEVVVKTDFVYHNAIRQTEPIRNGNISSFPTITVRAVTPLIVSGNVHTEVSINVLMWSEDMEFGGMGFIPASSVNDPARIFDGKQPMEALPQIGPYQPTILEHKLSKEIVHLGDGNKLEPDAWDRFAHGCRVLNLRDCIHRAWYTDKFNIQSSIWDADTWIGTMASLFTFYQGGFVLVPAGTNDASLSCEDPLVGAAGIPVYSFPVIPVSWHDELPGGIFTRFKTTQTRVLYGGYINFWMSCSDDASFGGINAIGVVKPWKCSSYTRVPIPHTVIV
jgi:hypothetical protein